MPEKSKRESGGSLEQEQAQVALFELNSVIEDIEHDTAPNGAVDLTSPSNTHRRLGEELQDGLEQEVNPKRITINKADALKAVLGRIESYMAHIDEEGQAAAQKLIMKGEMYLAVYEPKQEKEKPA